MARKENRARLAGRNPAPKPVVVTDIDTSECSAPTHDHQPSIPSLLDRQAAAGRGVLYAFTRLVHAIEMTAGGSGKAAPDREAAVTAMGDRSGVLVSAYVEARAALDRLRREGRR